MNAVEDVHARPHPAESESEPRDDVSDGALTHSEEEESGLDFLALALSQNESTELDSNRLHVLDSENGPGKDQDQDRYQGRGQSNISEQRDGEDDNESVDADPTSALERELVALLSQVNSNASDSHSESVQAVAPDPSSSGGTSAGAGGDQAHHDQYLSGLAAVLQAIQTHGAVKHTPGFHSLTADSAQIQAATTQLPDPPVAGTGRNEEVNGHGQLSNGDFSDLLARITAQLEQVEGPPPPPAPPSHGYFPSSGRPPFPSSLPGPSGSTPYSPYGGGFQGDPSPGAPRNPSRTKRRRARAPAAVNEKTGRPPPEKEKKVFLCDYCPKSFGRKSDVLRHMKIHTGDRPFVCPYEGCGKNFIQRSALHVHLRVHSGEKPHMCEYPLCGRTFSDSSSLARHRRTHTGRRPYACNWQDCTKTFTRRTALTQHMRTHDPNWEPDPNVRYNFKPKKRKTDSGVEEVDEEDEEGGDVPIDPALEESVKVLSALLAQTTPDQLDQAMPSSLNGTSSTTQDGANTLDARVAAISAEIAAAIAQANLQAQLNADDEEEGEDEGSDEEEEERGNERRRPNGNAGRLDVSAARTEQLLSHPPPPFPASQSIPVSGSSSTTATEHSTPASVPSAPGVGSTGATFVANAELDEEDDIDFYVPLRERRPKPTTSVSVGRKRKR